MSSSNRPDYPYEDLQLLHSYQQEIEGILQELKSIEGLPYPLIKRLHDLQNRIIWDIQQYICREQIAAPDDPIDF